jgi:hypothetical protein
MPYSVVPLSPESPDASVAWLRQQTSKGLSGDEAFLFALVDVARTTSTQRNELPKSIAMVLEHQSINLYADLEGTALADSGPRLCAVTDALLTDWAVTFCQINVVSFMAGTMELQELAGHLQSLREVLLPDGSEALFRFQDCHVTRHLWPLLTPGLANQILGPLDWWATPCPCGPLHVLSPAQGYIPLGGLRFNRAIFDRLSEDLLVYTVADQVRDVDASLLEGLTDCEVCTLLLARLDEARRQGLELQSDLALFVVLSLQLPDGFARQEPFASALESNRRERQTFGASLEQAPTEQWRRWNVELAKP